MPQMDGFETTHLILQRYSKKKCPIIAMTANVMKDHKDKCFEVGMNDFIAKPIKVTEIERVIRKWT